MSELPSAIGFNTRLSTGGHAALPVCLPLAWLLTGAWHLCRRSINVPYIILWVLYNG